MSAAAAKTSETNSKRSESQSATYLQGTKEYFEQVRTITIGAQGWYATPEALKAAVPVGENGWWAVVGTTDTIWTWDNDTKSWKDSIQKADLSDYYTKAQADAKFGTPYTLPAATADQLGGVKVGRGLTVSADGTLEMTAENLDTVLGFSLAEKLNQLRGVTDMNGKLVYTSDGAAGKSNKTMTVPDEVDYIVVRMAVPLECTTIATTGGVAAAAAADYGCTRIVRGGTAVAIVGGGNTYNLRDGVYCKGEALVKVSFAANGTVNIGVVDVNLASNDNAYPFNVEGYQYV